MQRGPKFDLYRSQLGLPEPIDVLPVQKTVQFPVNAINADESQSDGNWEVLTSLLAQVSFRTQYVSHQLTLQSLM